MKYCDLVTSLLNSTLWCQYKLVTFLLHSLIFSSYDCFRVQCQLFGNLNVDSVFTPLGMLAAFYGSLEVKCRRKKGNIIDYKALQNNCSEGKVLCTDDEKCLGFLSCQL